MIIENFLTSKNIFYIILSELKEIKLNMLFFLKANTINNTLGRIQTF
jgi:hypothetical protein